MEDNLVEAQIGQSGYTEGNLALSSYYRVIQSEDDSTYLLAPGIVEERLISTELPFYQSTGAFGVTQDRIGSFIYYDYSDKHKARRSDTTAIWLNIFKQTKQEVGGLAVNGGNEYTLPYADWIKNCADLNNRLPVYGLRRSVLSNAYPWIYTLYLPKRSINTTIRSTSS